MSVFYKSGFERVSVLGNVHDVRGHWVSRDDWGRESRYGIPVEAKVNFLRSRFRSGRLGASVTYPTNCPECGKSVFFYRNACGGAVWFNSLGWPWPKHECMDIEGSSCSFDYFTRQDAKKAEEERLQRLAAQKLKARNEVKAQRRSEVQLWEVYGAARFYRVNYNLYWEPKWFVPEGFSLTPRALLSEVAGSMKSIDVSTKNFNDRWGVRQGRPAKLYGPRKAKMIADYFDSTMHGLFGFVQRDGSVIYSYPLRFLRAIRGGGHYYIAAVSELFPWVGLWLKTDVGLRHFRQRHALLEWTQDQPDSMHLNYISLRQGRLNWREVGLVGIFDGRRAISIQNKA